MYDWIRDNQFILTLGVSTCTLLVWIFYAQLLLLSHQRQRRPSIIINRGAGKDMLSLCLISNMSAEPVFINQIFFLLHGKSRSYVADVTDEREGSEEDDATSIVLGQATHQGPLRTGDFIHIGSFAALIRKTAHEHGLNMCRCLPEGDAFHALEIRVVAFYGSDPEPIGVNRVYDIRDNDADGLFTGGRQTAQLTTSRQRRKVRREWLDSRA